MEKEDGHWATPRVLGSNTEIYSSDDKDLLAHFYFPALFLFPLKKKNMRLTALIMMLALFSGCESIYSTDGPVGKALKEEVRYARKTVIHLSNLTPFEWDEAYFYDPYTPRQVICESLGITAKSCPREIG
ncbi:MAG: hypothetical protein KJP23_08220 [Deltaproteobacteria bacterium]|nr:hypothetical protein [Deltaproteobacteria bacterium]